jgi:hypothetical protein
VDVINSIAYFGSGASLEIVDFSDPANPVELGKVFLSYPLGGITINDGYVYIANGYVGLRIIDVSDSQSPQEVGYYDIENYALDITFSGSFVYVADGKNGLYIVQNDLLSTVADIPSEIPRK